MLGIRHVKTEEEAGKIASQYARAMSRRSAYVCDTLAHHLARPETEVYEGFHDDDEGSYLVGQKTEFGVFAISHFAPKTLRAGVSLMHHAARDIVPLVLAVPAYQAKQAMKAGWHLVGMTRQVFAGQMVGKFVLINDGVSRQQLAEIMSVCALTLLRPNLP